MNFPDMFGFLESKLFWFFFFAIFISGFWKIVETAMWLYNHINIS